MDAPTRPQAVEGRVSRALWKISLPIIFVEVTESILHVVDSIFLGRIGVLELGAIALADSILEIWIVLLVGLSEAIQVLVARRMGEGRDSSIGPAFNHGLLVVTLVSLCLMGALKAVAPFAAEVVTNSGKVSAAVNEFLQIIAFAIPFLGATFAYSALYVGIGRTKVLAIAALLLTVTNVILGYALILGNLGSSRRGLEGAALAALGAEIVMVGFLAVYTHTIRRPGSTADFSLAHRDSTITRPLLRLGLPVAFQASLESLRWLGFFIVVGYVSEAALAASNIIYICFILLLIPTIAFAEATISLVSKAMGAKEPQTVLGLVRRAITSGYAITVPLAAIAVVWPETVASIFTSEPAAIEASSGTIRLVALAMLIVVPAETWAASLIGVGDTSAASTVELSLTVVMLLWAYLAAFVWDGGLLLVWTAIPLAWGMAFVMSRSWMRWGRWQRIEL